MAKTKTAPAVEEKNPKNKAEAIRWVMERMGAEAKGVDIAAAVMQQYPDFGKVASAEISMAKKKMFPDAVSTRGTSSGSSSHGKKGGTIDIVAAEAFVTAVGGTGKAITILETLGKMDVSDLRKAVGFLDVAKSSLPADMLETVLASLREKAAIEDGADGGEVGNG